MDEPKPTLESTFTSALDLACIHQDREVAARPFMTLARFLGTDSWPWDRKPDH